MATVMLIRHGRTQANAEGILAGTAEGTPLDHEGIVQATNLAEALLGVTPQAIISSPLERTMQTAEIIAESKLSNGSTINVVPEPRLMECNYGAWTGRSLSDLANEDLWRAVQDHPSSVTFPGELGESMLTMQNRAVSAIRHWNDLLGEDSLYIAVSHGDVIKSIIADALGVHLDQFQRLVVDPCSVSVIRYSKLRPFVVTTNSGGDKLDRYIRAASKNDSDAAIGGGNA